MVKKLICLLLVLTCAFTLFACGEDEVCEQHVDANGDNKCDNCEADVTPEQPPEDDSDSEAEFFEIIENSHPNRIDTVTSVTDKNSSDVYMGEYAKEIKGDGSYVFDYWYEFPLAVTPENIGSTERVDFREGKILYANGLYSEDDGATWSARTPEISLLGIKFELKKEYLGDYKMNKDGNVLTATVSAENAKNIFGLDINTEDDITIKIENNGTYISKITVTYENDVAKSSIITSYSYVAVEEATPAE